MQYGALVIGSGILLSVVSCAAGDEAHPETPAPTVYGVEVLPPEPSADPTPRNERLYFDVAETAILTAAQPFARFNFEATSYYASLVNASSTAVALSLDLYVAEGSTWRLVEHASGEGTVDVGTRPNRARTYRVELSGALSVPIRVTLSCLADCHNKCAVMKQPDDTCTAASSSCDEGLFCSGLRDTCDSTSQEGRCRKVPSTCDSRWAPVCGCDGVTYASACVAANHRMSVARDGECERNLTAL